MALREKTQSNTRYLLVKHNSLVLESKEPRDGYEEITVHNPKTDADQQKWIKRYAAVDGLIKRIEWYDTQDNYQTRFMGIKIHLSDAGEYFQIDLPFNSRPYDSFTKLMENIDFAEPVEFSAWHDRKQDSTAFAVRQQGVPIKWKYTRDNMGACPVPTQDSFGKWNFQNQKEWLYRRLIDIVIPQVEALNAFDEPQEDYTDDEYSGTPPKEKAATATANASVTYLNNSPDQPPSNLVEPPDGFVDNDSIPF